jgi:putative membrane protein insertion efficiency factor
MIAKRSAVQASFEQLSRQLSQLGRQLGRLGRQRRNSRGGEGVTRFAQLLTRLFAGALLAVLWFYRACISPLYRPCCRFEPSCSAYAEGCLRKYGVMQGLLKTGWRLLRCHPFGTGGYDPP